MTDKYIITIAVWFQSSGNYDAERRLRTKVFDGSATLAEVQEWVSEAENGTLGSGDPVITRSE